MFCKLLFVLFLLAIVCQSSSYGFYLPPWYLQTFHTEASAEKLKEVILIPDAHEG